MVSFHLTSAILFGEILYAKVLLFRDYSQTKSEINFNEFCNSLKNMVLLNDYLRKMK